MSAGVAPMVGSGVAGWGATAPEATTGATTVRASVMAWLEAHPGVHTHADIHADLRDVTYAQLSVALAALLKSAKITGDYVDHKRRGYEARRTA